MGVHGGMGLRKVYLLHVHSLKTGTQNNASLAFARNEALKGLNSVAFIIDNDAFAKFCMEYALA